MFFKNTYREISYQLNSIAFSILLTLVSKHKVSRDYLSEKYELSTRTISRYVDTLLDSGVPIISTSGKNGGYTLADDYKLDKSFFTDMEKLRIISILKTTQNNFDDKINSDIIDKLTSLSPNPAGENFLISDYLIIDAGSWNSPENYKNKINVFTDAIRQNKSVTIKYVDRRESYSERKINPYNLVLKEGIWYIYGFCTVRNDYRLFKLSRISYIFNTDEPFQKRSDADVFAKLNAQFEIVDEVDLEIEFSNTILSQIEEWLGLDAIYEEGIQYKAIATLQNSYELVSKILSFGSGVKVIHPRALREELLIECKRILRNVYNID